MVGLNVPADSTIQLPRIPAIIIGVNDKPFMFRPPWPIRSWTIRASLALFSSSARICGFTLTVGMLAVWFAHGFLAATRVVFIVPAAPNPIPNTMVARRATPVTPATSGTARPAAHFHAFTPASLVSFHGPPCRFRSC